MIDLGSEISIKRLLGELRSRKDIAFTVITVIIALFIAGIINRNLGRKVASLREEVERQKRINVSATTLKDLQGKFDGYQKILPESINAYTALEIINKIAAENDMRLISVSPGEAKDKSVYLEYPLNIKLETNYSELANFTKKLESLKIFKILSLEVSSQMYRRAVEDVKYRLSVNMSLLAISLK